MKIRFTNVTTEEVGGSYIGIAAEYEATDSDGAGNFAIDSGGLAPTDSYQPTYISLASIEALTQTQLYADFKPKGQIAVDGGAAADQEWYEYTKSTMYSQGEIITRGAGTDPSAPTAPEAQFVSLESAWLEDLQEKLDNGIHRAKVAAGLITIESVEGITDQTPIDI